MLLFTSWIRVRLLDVPLERDEGEYAYTGELILEGVPPFAEAWNLKYPGIDVVYAGILALGGRSVSAIHGGLLVASVLNAILCFLLGRKLLGTEAGLVAGSAYAAASLSPGVLGLWAHAEVFALVFDLSGLLLLLSALEKKSLLRGFASGLLLGAAVTVLQSSVPFAAFGAAWILWTGWRGAPRRHGRTLAQLAVFAAGVVLPAAAMVAWLAASGVLSRFWFWTFHYAMAYGREVPLRQGVMFLLLRLPLLVGTQLLWWFAAGVGLVTVLWNRRVQSGPFLLGLLGAGAVAVSFGLYFRPHYFVLVLPAVALLAAAGVHVLLPSGPRARALGSAGVALVGLAFPLAIMPRFFFSMTPEQVDRAIYPTAPFSQAVVLARHIAADTSPDARIAVIGSEPEIYFYAHRRAATGYLYMYPLVEAQPFADQMQHEMIDQIEVVRPEILVFVNLPNSWVVHPTAPRFVFYWFDHYAKAGYERVGIADILPKGKTRYVWGDAARSYRPQSRSWVAVWRRRN